MRRRRSQSSANGRAGWVNLVDFAMSALPSVPIVNHNQSGPDDGITRRPADRNVGGFFMSNWYAELIANVYLDEALLSEIVHTSTPDQTSVAPASIGLTPPIKATNANSAAILGGGAGEDRRNHNDGDCQSDKCFCQRAKLLYQEATANHRNSCWNQARYSPMRATRVVPAWYASQRLRCRARFALRGPSIAALPLASGRRAPPLRAWFLRASHRTYEMEICLGGHRYQPVAPEWGRAQPGPPEPVVLEGSRTSSNRPAHPWRCGRSAHNRPRVPLRSWASPSLVPKREN